MLQPIDLPLMGLMIFWYALMLLYAAIRIVPCCIGDAERRFRARGLFRAELGRSGLPLLSLTLKFTALAMPRGAHHGPWAWAWVVPLVFLVAGPLLKRCRNQPRPTRYTRALRAAQRSKR